MNAITPEFTKQAKPLSPRSHAVLDAASGKYTRGNSDAKANFLQNLDVMFNKAASDIASNAMRVIAQAKARIDAQAQPIDCLSIINGVQSDSAVQRDTAIQDLTPKHQRLALADTNNAVFEREEGLAREASPNYALRPTLAAAIAPVMLAGIEIGAIAAYLGPFAPGGRLQAVLMAAAGSVSIAALGWGLGYFSLRAWSVANRRVRLAARASAGVVVSGAFALVTFTMGYRTSLETGKAISEAMRHLSADSAFLGVATGLIFGLTALKARGGGKMPYPPEWRRERVDKPFRLALEDVEQSEEHQLNLLLQEIFVPAIEMVRDVAPKVEDALATLDNEASTVIDNVLGMKQRLRDLHSAARRDHGLYCAEFKVRAPDAQLAEFEVELAELPDAETILRSALANARGRLETLRRFTAELDRDLTTMRDESIHELEAAFHELRAQAYAAQVEETTDA